MEILWKFYRNSIELLTKFYRNSIEILWKFYCNSIELQSKIYRNPMEIRLKCYGNSMDYLFIFITLAHSYLSAFAGLMVFLWILRLYGTTSIHYKGMETLPRMLRRGISEMATPLTLKYSARLFVSRS